MSNNNESKWSSSDCPKKVVRSTSTAKVTANHSLTTTLGIPSLLCAGSDTDALDLAFSTSCSAVQYIVFCRPKVFGIPVSNAYESWFCVQCWLNQALFEKIQSGILHKLDLARQALLMPKVQVAERSKRQAKHKATSILPMRPYE